MRFDISLRCCPGETQTKMGDQQCNTCGMDIPLSAYAGICPGCAFSRTFSDSGNELNADLVARKYRLLEKIGEGGFGEVFRAKQVRPIQRLVALKVTKPGFESSKIIARFESERQALALLEHSGIAAILDAGETDEGRPFFVMELVEGVPVTDFVAASKLSLTELLGLFCKICEAVGHAHQRGIIHRDLKPANILVTSDGKSKVIDFGIAKATEQLLTDETLLTRADEIIGTPEYMSPEQAASGGLDVDTRSDVYSLGAVLYELIAGEPPFIRNSRSGYLETLRLVTETEPRPPSEVAAAPGKSKLPQDVDWIILKTLSKERCDRYGGTRELIRDIERFLNSEPVEAREQGAVLYRVRKLLVRMTRNKVAFILGLMAIGIFVAGFGGVVWQWQTAKRHAARAEAAVSHMQLERAEEFFAADDSVSAIELLRTVIKRDPKHPVASRRLSAALAVRRFAEPIGGRLRHDGPLRSVAFSSNGHYVVTAGEDATARIWNGRTGAPIWGALLHSSRVRHAIFSPNDQYIVSGAEDGQVKVWDANGGNLLSSLDHDGVVRRLAFSGDGGVLVAACGAGYARTWNTTTWEPLHDFRHDDYVNVATLTADGKYLATTSDDSTLKLWSVQSGGLLWTEELAEHVYAADFSRNGKLLLVADVTGKVRLIDIRTRQRLIDFTGSSSIYTVAMSPDGSRAAAAGIDGKTYIWNLCEAAPPLIVLHRDRVNRVMFSPSGVRLLTASEDHTVRVWDSDTGKPLFEPMSHDAPVEWAEFSPDGTEVATADFQSAGQLWKLTAGGFFPRLFVHEAPVLRSEFCPVTGTIFTSDIEGVVRVWHQQGAMGRILEHPDNVVEFAISPNGELLATACQDGCLRIWDVLSGRLVVPPIDLPGKPQGKGLLWHPETEIVAVILNGVDSHSVQCFDTVAGHAVGPSFTHSRVIRQIAFDRNGNQLATASVDNTAMLWDVATGKPLSAPIKHFAEVFSVQFDKTGRRVITASQDGTSAIHEVPSGKVSQVLQHGSGLRMARFSPDGSVVATASVDGEAVVWDSVTGEEKLRMVHGTAVRDVLFCDGGRKLVTSTAAGAIHLWDSATGLPLCSPYQNHVPLGRLSVSSDESIVVASYENIGNNESPFEARHTVQLWPMEPHESGALSDAEAFSRALTRAGTVRALSEAISIDPTNARAFEKLGKNLIRSRNPMAVSRGEFLLKRARLLSSRSAGTSLEEAHRD